MRGSACSMSGGSGPARPGEAQRDRRLPLRRDLLGELVEPRSQRAAVPAVRSDRLQILDEEPQLALLGGQRPLDREQPLARLDSESLRS
jgi:hypothetical protein